jgi:hypothetical protein
MESVDSPTQRIRFSVEHLFMVVIPLLVKMGYGMDVAQCATLSHETFLHKARVGILNESSYPTVEHALLISPYTIRQEKAMKFFPPTTAFFMLRGAYLEFFNRGTVICIEKFKRHVRHRMAFISNSLWTTQTEGPIHFVPQHPFDDHPNVEHVPLDHCMVSLPRTSLLLDGDGEASVDFDPIFLIETENYSRYYSMTIIFDVIHDEVFNDHKGLRKLFAIRDFLSPVSSIHWKDYKKQLAYAFDMYSSVFSTTIINRRYLSEPYFSEVNAQPRPREDIVQWRTPWDPVLGTRVDVFSFMTCIAQAQENRSRTHTIVSHYLCDGFQVLFDEINQMKTRYSQYPGSPYKDQTISQSLEYKFPIGVSPLHYLVNGQFLQPLKLWFRCANFPPDKFLINRLYTNVPGTTPTTPMQYARCLFHKYFDDPIIDPTLDSPWVIVRNVAFVETSYFRDLFDILWLLYEKGGVEACETGYDYNEHLTMSDRIAAQAFGIKTRHYRTHLNEFGHEFLKKSPVCNRMTAPKFFGWLRTDYDRRERDLALRESIEEMGYYSA